MDHTPGRGAGLRSHGSDHPGGRRKTGTGGPLDTGWTTYLETDRFKRRRRKRAWIFTPSVARYRFDSACSKDHRERIEAWGAARAFYGGVLAVVIPDDTTSSGAK